MMDFILIVISLLLGIYSIWALHISQKTFNQRMKLLNFYYFRDYKNVHEFKNIDFDEHYWTLFFFKNPMKLYRSYYNAINVR